MSREDKPSQLISCAGPDGIEAIEETLIQVFHREQCAKWGPLRQLGIGVGITLEEADQIADQTNLTEVMSYAEEVQGEVLTWLDKTREDELDQVLDIRKRLAPYPEYQTTQFIEEAGGVFDHPIWSQLMRPCIGHVYRHLGELEVIKEYLRSR